MPLRGAASWSGIWSAGNGWSVFTSQGVGKTLLTGASAKRGWKKTLERLVSGGIVVQIRHSGLRGTAEIVSQVTVEEGERFSSQDLVRAEEGWGEEKDVQGTYRISGIALEE